MKKTIILASLLSVGFVSAQTGRVGINTNDPKATLEVKGTPTDTRATDGLIAPKIEGNQLKAKDNLYNDDQKGALVYVTAVPTTRTGKVVNVDSVGYYYFDGVVWVKIGRGITSITNHSTDPTKAVINYTDGTSSTINLPKGDKGNNGANGLKGEKGDNGPEPWRVQNTTTEATANNQNIYQNGNVGIGDFSNGNENLTTNNNKLLDIKGSLRIRNLEPNTTGKIYALSADKDGNVVKTPENNFVGAGSTTAKNYVDYTVPSDKGINFSHTMDLGISVDVKVPAGRKYAVLLQASVPMGTNAKDATSIRLAGAKGNGPYTLDTTVNVSLPKRLSGYYGFNIHRKENNTNDTELEEASRKVVMVERTDKGVFSMTTISTQFYQELDNTCPTCTQEKTYTYYLKGYVEKGGGSSYGGLMNLDTYTVRFNMSGNNSEKWGKASLSYQIFNMTDIK